MLYKQWAFFYEKIARDLNLKIEYEKTAANVLDKLLKQEKTNLLSEKKLRQLIKNKEVVVFGAGPSLDETILKYHKMIEDKVKITADGATTALLKNNILPDIIVTDLDGKISDLIKASSLGSKTIIHAHGDNINKINNHVLEFEGEIFGTTQINPQSFNFVYNYGGFTDGDRAVFLSDHFQAKKIYLAGFDFDGRIGKYSFVSNKDKKLKLKKLKWCKYLIEVLEKENNNIHYLRV
jgi:uncharacterized Rossmann fold enzyme